MKVLAADYAQYVPRERLVERFRYETGFASKKTQGGPFFLTEYKGGEGAKGAELRFLRSGEGIYSIFDTIVPIVGTVANAVSKGANYYKELLGGGIEPEALAEVLKVEDTKPTEKAVVGEESASPSGRGRGPSPFPRLALESSTASASETATAEAVRLARTALQSVAKMGKEFFYICPR